MKTIGIIILIISGISAGFTVFEKYSKKVTFLHLYFEFIIYLKNEIRYSQKTLYEIFKNYTCSEPLAQYIAKCNENLKHQSFENSWKNALYNIATLSNFSKDEKDIILGLGTSLGKSDIQSQMDFLSEHINIIKTLIKNAENKKKSKGNLPIILGASLGLAIALILI